MTNTKRDELPRNRKGEIILNDVFDAKIWAQEFMRIKTENNLKCDESWMLTWFANAIMAGYDHAKRESRPSAGGLSVRELHKKFSIFHVDGCPARLDWNDACDCGLDQLLEAQSRPIPAGGLSVNKLMQIIDESAGFQIGINNIWMIADAIYQAQSRERGEEPHEHVCLDDHDQPPKATTDGEAVDEIKELAYELAFSREGNIHQTPSDLELSQARYLYNQGYRKNIRPEPKTQDGEGEAVELAKMVVRFKRGECALPNMCGAAEEFLSKHNSK